MMFRVRSSQQKTKLLGQIDPLTSALIARMSTAPSADHRKYIDRLMVSLKEAGVLSKMDAFYVLAAQDTQTASLNWIADAYNITATDPAPTFEAFKGDTPNGTTSYLNTNFNPTTAVSPKLVRDSGHMGAWHLTNNINGAGSSFDIGNDFSRIIKLSTGSIQIRANTNAASAALTNATIKMGTTDLTNFGVNKVAIAHFGSQLTAAEAASIRAACHTYLRSVGAI